MIAIANPKQIKVFKVKGSLNKKVAPAVNTIIPIENPRSLEGYIAPPAQATNPLTE
jgi:hypothetical protein